LADGQGRRRVLDRSGKVSKMPDEATEEWRRYGSAVIAAMADVLDQAHDESHPVLLETADYWLSLGLTIGVNRPEDGRRLLHLIEAEEPNRKELSADAEAFISEVLG